jgi:hypothetical protein
MNESHHDRRFIGCQCKRHADQSRKTAGSDPAWGGISASTA